MEASKITKLILTLPFRIASLYCSVPPYTGLEFVGAIANERPSDIFHTGWALNPTINTLSEIKLVVQFEPLSQIETCIKIKQETDLNKEFAKKVAYNLFNFLQSFNKVISLILLRSSLKAPFSRTILTSLFKFALFEKCFS